MKNNFGVMQGRLLPKYQERYQAHPVSYWQEEFELAKNLDLQCIEFILDFNDAEINPLLREGGIDEIKMVSGKTGIHVKTICADYLMEAPIHSEDQIIVDQSQKVLIKLLQNAAKLGVTDIVIPCVDQSSLNGKGSAGRFIEQLTSIVKLAEKLNINLSLETDLAPQPFIKLLKQFQSHRVTVNYDIGNSAAFGYDPVQELNAYGSMITDIHIKDRLLGGGPVLLGKGSADFKAFFKKLKELDYKGPFIMQAFRDDEGVEIFKKQLKWILNVLSELHYE
jgi:L-ribulose-5-phosphate 3-epimerase